jgi:hypothetical protein
MSTRTLIILVVVVASLLRAFVALHTPGGQGVIGSIRALHGGD